MNISNFVSLKLDFKRMLFTLVALVLGAVVLIPTGGGPATEGGVVLAQDNPTYEDHINDGLWSLRSKKYADALKSFKKASEMRDSKSADALICMAEAYQGLTAYKNVIETCDKVILLAGDDAKLQARAYNLKGVALQLQSVGKDLKKLQEAEAMFRQALKLNPDLANLHYNLGVTLLLMERDTEGIAELKEYVEGQPDRANVGEARKMIENPRRAREPFAPDISITTSEGEYLDLADLHGKVVLLDFWGTWCGPCVESVPALRNLYKRYGGEAFQIIGVSTDSNKEVWSTFIVQKKMIWPQYLDQDGRVRRAFQITGYPTYIVIDHEGVIRYRSTGYASDMAGKLEDAIRKQLKVVAKAAASN